MLSALILNVHRPGSGSLVTWAGRRACPGWGNELSLSAKTRPCAHQSLTTDTECEPHADLNLLLPMEKGARMARVSEGVL